MKKKYLFFISLLMGSLIVSCHPNMGKDSSVQPGGDSSSGSSGEISPSSEGGDDSSTTEDTGDDSSNEEGEDNTSQSSSEVAPHTHAYPSTPTRFESDPDYSNYVKGYNVYVCTQDGCNEEKREAVYYTKSEMLSVMNSFINGKEYFDLFEIREDLIKNNYPIVDSLSEDEYFGLDVSNPLSVKLALSTDTTVEHFISYREKVVANKDELDAALAEIENSVHSFSTVKLSNGLTINHPITLDLPNPVHFDLNGQLIDYTAENESAIMVARHSNNHPVVAITNGSVRTKFISGYNFEQSPKCIYFESGDSLRITNMTLNNRAERGYAYADHPDKTATGRVKINKSKITSSVIAICIQTNYNYIVDNMGDDGFIKGTVVVNGGNADIYRNNIDTTNLLSGLGTDNHALIDNTEFASYCHDLYITRIEEEYNTIYDTYVLSSVDCILVYDRRSQYNTYVLGDVNIDYNTFNVKSSNVEPLGYAVRYLDLNFDGAQANPNTDNVAIGDPLLGDHNTYTNLAANVEDPYGLPGGTNIE